MANAASLYTLPHLSLADDFTRRRGEGKISKTRIFNLDPLSSGDAVTGTLTVINLEEDPTFSALSYCWGPPTDSKVKICCNLHYDVQVQQNCVNAHLQLRKAHAGKRPGQTLAIWVVPFASTRQLKQRKMVRYR